MAEIRTGNYIINDIQDRLGIKYIAATGVARLANRLLGYLRGDNIALTREEFRHAKITFSQSGEDLAVLRWLTLDIVAVPKLFVDAGAFHPIHGSNTLLLSKYGWHGINIDMSEARIALFHKLRPRDLNVAMALSDKQEDLLRHAYASQFTDRLGTKNGDTHLSLIGETPTHSHPVRTTTLNSILEQSGMPQGPFGYLNVDCEGFDLKVLKGLDLVRYRPAVITIEASSEEDEVRITGHLGQYGYQKREHLFRTLFFVKTEFLAR